MGPDSTFIEVTRPHPDVADSFIFQFKHYYPTAGENMKDLLAQGNEPAIPSVAKFLNRAKEVTIHELTQMNK